MKRKLLVTGMLLSFLISCKNQESRIMDSGVIDIEHGLQNLTRLKVSDLGKTIRYIPLETTDDGLVGANPTVKVLRDYIIIEFPRPRSCLLFSKKDGSFIAEIGHLGQDPQAYTDNFSWTDEKEEFLYFQRNSNQLVKYDMKGQFHERIEFSTSLASYFLMTDSEIIGYFSGLSSLGGIGVWEPYTLGIFDKEGNLKDTIPQLLERGEQIMTDGLAGITIYRSHIRFGNWANAGMMFIDLKNDTRQVTAPKVARLWKNGEHIRFKEDFVDTLYTVSDSRLIPSFVFHAGKYQWPIQEVTSKKGTNERIFVADVSENNNSIFFQCIRGMYADEPILYNGLYNKKTGETKLGIHGDGIEDDLNRFMPFIPLGMSTAGEFVSLVEVGNVMEWLENHPEALNNEKLSFLKNLDEDMNPIVILIEDF